MAIRRMDHVGVVVDDLDEAIAFFAELGLEQTGQGSVEGEWVDRIVGLEGVMSDIVFLGTPDGGTRLELTRFQAPRGERARRNDPANAPGLRHLSFVVDDLDAAVAGVRGRGWELVGEVVAYEDVYRLCYVRGPAGIIVELAQPIG
jgi:catechol 2,3-dioxygenase-like lactoylglutathione lyase family enzyme